MIAAVPRYASATSSSICSGCGDRSSSTETVPKNPVSTIACRYSSIGVDAPPGGEVAVHLSVAIRDVHVPDHPAQHGDVGERGAGELEVRDVGVRLDRRMVDPLDEAGKLVDARGDRVLERLQLDDELEPSAGVLGELPDVLGDEPEDLLGAEHLEVAVVLAGDEHTFRPSRYACWST